MYIYVKYIPLKMFQLSNISLPKIDHNKKMRFAVFSKFGVYRVFTFFDLSCLERHIFKFKSAQFFN